MSYLLAMPTVIVPRGTMPHHIVPCPDCGKSVKAWNLHMNQAEMTALMYAFSSLCPWMRITEVNEEILRDDRIGGHRGSPECVVARTARAMRERGMEQVHGRHVHWLKKLGVPSEYAPAAVGELPPLQTEVDGYLRYGPKRFVVMEGHYAPEWFTAIAMNYNHLAPEKRRRALAHALRHPEWAQAFLSVGRLTREGYRSRACEGMLREAILAEGGRFQVRRDGTPA